MSVLRRIWLLMCVFARRVANWIESTSPATDVTQLLEQSKTLKRRLVDVSAVTSLLEWQAEKQRELIHRLGEEAARALVDGHRDRARHALEQKAIASEELEAIDRQLEASATEERDLTRASAALLTQVDALLARQGRMETRREGLTALVSARHSLVEVTQTLRGMDAGLERQQDDLWALEGRAAALDAATGQASDRPWSGKQIVEEAGHAARADRVDDELDRLSRLSEGTIRRAEHKHEATD